MPSGFSPTSLNRLPLTQGDDAMLNSLMFVNQLGQTVLAPAVFPCPSGLAQVATSGTDVACTNGTAYVSQVIVTANKLLTGVGFLIGSVGGTNNVIVTLYDSNGTLLASNAAAGTLVGTAANYQQVPFTTAYQAGPGAYLVALTFNGTTAKFRAAAPPALGYPAFSVAQTFGTIAASITPVTTYTVSLAPLCYLY